MLLKSPSVLKALMEQEAISIGKLAKASGCSKSMVSHLLAKRVNGCTYELAARIAESLHTPVAVLFAPAVSNAVRQSVADAPSTEGAQSGSAAA